MDSAPTASEKILLVEIHDNYLYTRDWMIAEIPGMHKNRILALQKKFGLIPVNSGNRESPFVYRGIRIIEALEREALHRLGESYQDDEDSQR